MHQSEDFLMQRRVGLVVGGYREEWDLLSLENFHTN